MVQGHWGGDIGGMVLVFASLTAFVGIQAPWWKVSATGPTPDEVHMTLWGPAAGQRLADGFEWGAACTSLSTDGRGAISIEVAEEDCSLIGWARALAISGVVMTFIATLVIALNKSSLNQCLFAAACSAACGSLCNFAAVLFAVSMPLAGTGGLGFVSMICSICLSTLAAFCMIAAKLVHKGSEARSFLATQHASNPVARPSE
mmetsp:Transcript_32851/g.83141  ORF Transcript_32851/g.83141 Transcript_32851/m.83141 type:complete len:203 (-) Transcript_32851:483-1091(-)